MFQRIDFCQEVIQTFVKWHRFCHLEVPQGTWLELRGERDNISIVIIIIIIYIYTSYFYISLFFMCLVATRNDVNSQGALNTELNFSLEMNLFIYWHHRAARKSKPLQCHMQTTNSKKTKNKEIAWETHCSRIVSLGQISLPLFRVRESDCGGRGNYFVCAPF